LECYVVLINIESWVKSSVQQHLTPSALVGYKIAEFRSLFARSDSAVTPSEKFQLTLVASPLRAFQ